MKLPRNVSGRRLISAVERVYGYRLVHQEGSHAILQNDSPRRHRLSVPDHKALRVGTLNAILRALAKARGVTKEQVVRELFD